MTWDNHGVLISDPEQVVLESDPYRRLSYTWHTVTPELAEKFGWDQEFPGQAGRRTPVQGHLRHRAGHPGREADRHPRRLRARAAPWPRWSASAGRRSSPASRPCWKPVSLSRPSAAGPSVAAQRRRGDFLTTSMLCAARAACSPPRPTGRPGRPRPSLPDLAGQGPAAPRRIHPPVGPPGTSLNARKPSSTARPEAEILRTGATDDELLGWFRAGHARLAIRYVSHEEAGRRLGLPSR